MKPLLTFQISESQSIQITIDEQNKVNIYGYAAEELHVFDEVEVRYIHGDHVVVLAKDIVQEVVTVFSVSLEKLLKNKLPLDKSLAIGTVGYFFSKMTYENSTAIDSSTSKMLVMPQLKHPDIFSKYWVWSSSESKIGTWLYSVDNKIYLEISQIYPWLFLAPQKDELYVSFDEYMNNYKPMVIVELQKERVKGWIDQGHTLLQTIM